MELDQLINDENQKLSWYGWLQHDLSILIRCNPLSPCAILQVLLRGITSWAYAKCGREKAPKERFMAICIKDLGLAKPLAAVLYCCKCGYNDMGMWPQELSLCVSPRDEIFWIQKEEGTANQDLVINVAGLANHLMADLGRRLPQGKNGCFAHMALYTGGEVIIDAIDHLRKVEGKGA